MFKRFPHKNITQYLKNPLLYQMFFFYFHLQYEDGRGYYREEDYAEEIYREDVHHEDKPYYIHHKHKVTNAKCVMQKCNALLGSTTKGPETKKKVRLTDLRTMLFFEWIRF